MMHALGEVETRQTSPILVRVSTIRCPLSKLSVGRIMCIGVASVAKCNQVVFAIAARLTAELLVVNLEICHSSAALTSPPISAQDLFMQASVSRKIEPEGGLFRGDAVHGAFTPAWAKKVSRCSAGRNLKNRNAD